MRIVSGRFGGRKLMQPKGRDVRPTSDKVRGAIFNILRGYDAVQDAYVLDGYCGTGALGLEALSNGAAHCTFVDYSASSLDLARGNADALGVVGQASFLRHDMRRVLRQKPQDKFTLIFLDAPYRNNLISQSLEWLIDFNCIDTDAFFVLEVEGDFDLDPRGSLTVHQQKIYGDTKVIFAQKRVIKYGAL